MLWSILLVLLVMWALGLGFGVAGNDKLKEEGKTDQVIGETKEAVQKVADKIKEVVKKVTE